ncbi:cation transporter [Asticcacaulis sp. AC466]|uniref:efflux RND transporter permease subunit n=1 Tax=Asticcacaulis sp. AC466 TaxID=1282362 RepID=UPI0003C3CF5F|nr:CusA/CzcA family heavy metal efflux RND transporter [Asticcacaulis sp. AC466]ESQ85164.1 cation transporter [Asticcacaulis sp. AC466]
MIAHLITQSIRLRWIVVTLVVLISAVGLWQLTRLPIDAVPDITNNQVQINTVDPGLSPLEMEKRVTFPLETALSGIPGLETTRSLSRNGFSQVTAIFSEKTDLYFARQQVNERIAQTRDALPEGVRPQIGPVTTGLGEVYMYAVDYGPKRPVTSGQPGWQSDGSYLTPDGERLDTDVARAAYLRTVQDWMIKPQLLPVKGVAGVDSIGGYQKQYVVEPDPARMAAYGVSYAELAQALEKANLSAGANYLNRGGEAFLIRADARIRGIGEIGETVVATRGGIGVSVRDLAQVRVGGDLRTGAASLNGHEVVIGTALMLIGENSRTVAKAAGARLEGIRKSLPPGIVVTPLLDRSQLVNATVATVERNLAEGALLVAATLFLLLGNVRAAIIAVLVIPVSFLMMAIGMNGLKVPGNLMSLGALDFGLVVDGSVIIIENSLRRLGHRQQAEGRLLTLSERLAETGLAAREMIKPTVFGQAIIFLVFVPLFTFSGVEGKTFAPMATTLMLALAAAFVLSLTFVPAMVALLVRGKVVEKEVWLIARIRTAYEPLLHRLVARPWPFIAAGVGIVAVSGLVFSLLGQEFIPQLDEKNLAMASSRVPSVSLEQSLIMQKGVEKAVSALPEVAFMYSKTGTAEVATDPMPPSISDGFIILKDKADWPKDVTKKADVVGRVEAASAKELGQAYELSQPIELRFNELIAGVRGDVAIKLYGDDLNKLGATAARMVSVLQAIPGAADVKAEQTDGSPTLDIQFDRLAIARYGLTVEEVADTVAVAMGGREAGLVFDGDRRFPIMVRTAAGAREDLDALGALPVMLPEEGGHTRRSVPLSQVASFQFGEGLNQISRENGSRRVVIQANVRGRDVGSFVREALPKIDAVPLPAGAHLQWGGQFQNLKAASDRLAIVVPICFAAIFGLLYLALGGFRRALAVFAAIPLGVAGGVFTLWMTGIAFSVSAAVGFICLSGVAVLNGLILMTSIRERLDAGMAVSKAIIEGTLMRIRPVIMTGLVPAIGFIPMALAHGTGAEVQKPLAIVVIGGLVGATCLTLLVLPAIMQVILKAAKMK